MDDCTPDSCRHNQRQPVWREFLHFLATFIRKLLHLPDQNYAWDYFMLVRAERDGLEPSSLGPDLQAQKRCDELIKLLWTKYCPIRYKLSIQEVWLADLALVQMLPAAALKAKAQSVRVAYCKISGIPVGCEPGTARQDDGKSREDTLRAEITDMMRGIYWHQLNAILLERGFRGLKRLLTRSAIHGLYLTAIAVAVLRHWPGGALGNVLSVGILCLYFGTLGAVISVARRTKTFDTIAASDSDPVVRLMRIENGHTGIRLSVITGGVFAVVLYLLLATGLHAGTLNLSLLPEFPYTEDQLDLGNMVPQDARSLCKLLLLAFTAGFAEQLVPDVLDRLSNANRRTARR